MQSMWRVTFTAHGLVGWIEMHCEADARRLASEGYEMGLFIQPQVTEVKY